jgi:hypothetical protein
MDPITNKFIPGISSELSIAEYMVENKPNIPGARALLYAHSPRPFRLGFAKVLNHFLFVDWENDHFSRLDMLLNTCQAFSQSVNQGFRVPHGLRMTIPNLAVIAVSINEFPKEVVDEARSKFLNPWYGGETGQIILIDLTHKSVFYRYKTRYREAGIMPPLQANEFIHTICKRYFSSQNQ